NSNPNATQLDPMTGLPQKGTALQCVQLTLPPKPQTQQGDVPGTIVTTLFTPTGTATTGLPLTATGADFAPNGDLVFVATTSAGGLGLFSIDPTDETSLNFIGAINLPPPGDQNETPPTITSIAFVGNTLYGILNGVSDEASQIVQINPINGNLSGG